MVVLVHVADDMDDVIPYGNGRSSLAHKPDKRMFKNKVKLPNDFLVPE